MTWLRLVRYRSKEFPVSQSTGKEDKKRKIRLSFPFLSPFPCTFAGSSRRYKHAAPTGLYGALPGCMTNAAAATNMPPPRGFTSLP
ncbi:Uncharacterized protein dnm_098920 [Desulfonema magnum]|uniref:Uncharacterized protein n=1 Tax=Desulfonema magnum TaxID=45655 RepID=A0A975BXV2_9BACT|nr:Uncharacterized protein dnm_098920 [Desulfonema magnum]